MPKSRDDLIASYDRIAARYAEEFFDELRDKPDDVAWLDRFVGAVRPGGTVLDIGCGPGQTCAYFRGTGIEAVGIDLSEGMIREARARLPEVRFECRSYLDLGREDGSVAGVVGFYALIHESRDGLPAAMAEIDRVLEPGAPLLLTLHGGSGVLRADEWFGEPVIIDATCFTTDEVRTVLDACGFEVESVIERAPYDFEFPIPRLYAFARAGRASKA